MNGFFRLLARNTYPYLFPGLKDDFLSGFDSFLLDVKTSAPLKTFLTYVVLCIFAFFSPLFFLESWKPLPFLNDSKREKVFNRWKRFPLYSVRLAFFGFRGHAHVALLRNSKARNYFGMSL